MRVHLKASSYFTLYNEVLWSLYVTTNSILYSPKLLQGTPRLAAQLADVFYLKGRSKRRAVLQYQHCNRQSYSRNTDHDIIPFATCTSKYM